MTSDHAWDGVTPEALRTQGSLKWTMHDQALPGFVAEMDFPIAPPILEALKRNLNAQRFGYLPQWLVSDLSDTVADYLAREFSWMVPSARILPTADVLVGYDVVLQELLAPGAPVIVPTPAYMPFLSLTPLRGHPVVEVPFVDHGGRPTLDLERIEKEFRAGAGLLVLCNPHNPLGLVHTREELLALSEVVDRVGGLVFADEIHSPLVFEGEHIPYAAISDAAANHTVTAVSASKAWNLAGLKCAQLIVTSDEHQQALAPKKFLISHGASTPGVEASIAAYLEGGDWLVTAKKYIADNITFATDTLHKAYGAGSFTPPQGTYIGWLNLRHVDHGSHDSVADYLLAEAGIALTDGARCGAAGADHVRIILATTRPILAEMFARLIRHTS